MVRGSAHQNGNELDGQKHEHDPFPRRLNAAKKRPASKLTTTERQEWQRALKAIEKGWSTFIEVGLTLRQIRESRLYREDYPSWKAFCCEVVGISKSEADRQIIDAEVVETLKTPIGVSGDEQPLPKNRSHARELAKLKDADARRQAWTQVLAKAGSRPITAKLVKETIEPVKPPKSPKLDAKPLSKKSNDETVNIAKIREMLERASKEADWALVNEVIDVIAKTDSTITM